jgi:hypothetical protein
MAVCLGHGRSHRQGLFSCVLWEGLFSPFPFWALPPRAPAAPTKATAEERMVRYFPYHAMHVFLGVV